MKLKINDSYHISDIALSDKAAYLAHLKEKQIYDQTLAIPFPYTEADADWWINHNIEATRKQNGRSVNWAIRRSDNHSLIGGIGFLGLQIGESHVAELGYWLAKPYWNKSVMTEAVKKASEYGFKEFGLVRITANVFHFNVGSARVLEKSGYRCEGYLRSHYKKDGQIFDGKLYALINPEFAKSASFDADGKQRTFSGAPWEAKVGYCRAIRCGNTVAITGTAPVTEEGKVFAVGKPYEQAKRCLEIIERAILPLGATRKDVIRTRIFVTDISKWQEFGRAHGEFFANHPPATTMVEVKSLIDPDMLVEIEADAIVLGPEIHASPTQNTAHLIFYVRDQAQSTAFYSNVLAAEPTLNVPGMTEFKLNDGCVLGLMPQQGIKRLLGDALPDPAKANGVPRAELYLRVDDPTTYHGRAIKFGGKELSPVDRRNWGDIAGYSMDEDGHVIAFARKG